MGQYHRIENIRVNGRILDFSHLKSFIHVYVFPAKNDLPEARFRVRVVFTDHCYTKGYPEDYSVDPDLVVSRGKGAQGKVEVRVFNESRYRDSLDLPDIIKTLNSRVCSFGDRSNFFTITATDGTKRYVFFKLRKSSNDELIMVIDSAHDREKQLEIQKADLFIILNDASRGEVARPRQERPENPKKRPTKRQQAKREERLAKRRLKREKEN